MARKILLPANRVHDLKTVLDSLTPAEIAKHVGTDTMKAIRGVSKLAEELEAADAGYVSLSDRLNAAVEPVRQEFEKRLKAMKSSESSKEDEEKLLAEANAEAKKVLDETSKELKFKEAGEKETEVIVGSDDRYQLLKELFPKIAPEKYVNTPACAATWSAIEDAKEI